MKLVHPIPVHVPIAFLTLSVAADLIGYFADVASLRDTGDHRPDTLALARAVRRRDSADVWPC
ncbi:MAG: DUF2231 domain-containing protein [Thermomonas sp.]